MAAIKKEGTCVQRQGQHIRETPFTVLFSHFLGYVTLCKYQHLSIRVFGFPSQKKDLLIKIPQPLISTLSALYPFVSVFVVVGGGSSGGLFFKLTNRASLERESNVIGRLSAGEGCSNLDTGGIV